MAKSIFQEFVKAVAKDWEHRFPWIQRVSVAYHPAMPKANTFYVGKANRFNRHVFLNFQHSSKAWSVGAFTVNVAISSQMGAPTKWMATSLEPDPDGFHRLGSLVYDDDKWWRLRPGEGYFPRVWRPVSYEDSKVVVDEAVKDLSHDVSLLFEKLNQRAG